ncbi:unnamed protein product [Cylicocyclus nassatus]|uniref:DUF4440 domain-containing protein n=1 Tax=Cylicocyclus nassatus TaxID=53992 RepID=A0AA36GHQ0_CYLNA|nr:unnamed protein product [Cylicocyclus nassatus]
MRSEEVKAILKPIYDAMDEAYEADRTETAFADLFHPDAVVVQKGVGSKYTRKDIIDGFKALTEEFGKVKMTRVNEHFCGSDDLLSASYDVKVDSPKKGRFVAKAFQVSRFFSEKPAFKKDLLLPLPSRKSSYRKLLKKFLYKETVAPTMKSEEVKAIISPIFEQAVKDYYAGNLEKAMNDTLHSNAVVVNKDVGAFYGKKAILENFAKMNEEFGQVKFEKVNDTYCGCECCLCTSFEFKVDSPKKGKVTAKVFQIYKKEDGKWKNYHEEFELHFK